MNRADLRAGNAGYRARITRSARRTRRVPARAEASAALMKDERRVVQDVAVSERRRSEAEVDLLAVAEAERFVECADSRSTSRLCRGTRRRRSEAVDTRGPRRARPPRRRRRRRSRWERVLRQEHRQRADGGVVRERRDGGDRGIGAGRGRSFSSQPGVTWVRCSAARRRDRRRRRRVHADDEPARPVVREHHEIGVRRRSSSTARAVSRVGRAVEDDDDAMRLRDRHDARGWPRTA